MLISAASFGLGVIVTPLFIRALRKPAEHFGLVDHPNHRKMHLGSIPTIGGIAMFLALLLLAALFHYPVLQYYTSLFLGIALLVMIGVMDDLHDWSARRKMLFQVLAVLLMIAIDGNSLSHLGNLFGQGSLELSYWAIPFTIFGVIGLINAINMVDGVDGLAGGLCLSSLLWLLIAASILGASAESLLLVSVIGVVLGFLLLNMRHPWQARASVFMGDAGSMMLGFILGWFAVHLSQLHGPALPPIATVWIFAVPLLDSVNVMSRRLLEGKSPFKADRGHLHHLLLDAGFSHAQTGTIMVLSSFLLGGVGMVAWTWHVPEYVLFYGFFALFVIYSFLTGQAWKAIKQRTALVAALNAGN